MESLSRRDEVAGKGFFIVERALAIEFHDLMHLRSFECGEIIYT